LQNNKEYSVIMFDFGGVIAEEGFVKGMEEIAKKCGLDPKVVVEAATDILYDSGYICGKTAEKEFWSAFKKRFSLDNYSDEELREEVLRRFVIRPWTLDLIRTLRSSDIKVVLLTDQTNWIEEINEETPFYDMFDHVFNSYRLGKCKHDGTIFKEILNILGVDPKDIILVDDRRRNITLAEEYGIKGILYKSKDELLRELFAYLPELEGKMA
jgi:putative hydrolase of the HAD superfamily